MLYAVLLSRAAAELALFAGAGFLLFGINDLLVAGNDPGRHSF
jgi:hypothetical protein